MRVVAYCAASFRESVTRAAGVDPLLSPPWVASALDVARLAGADLLYFKLHGLPGQPFWYGDGLVTALSAELVGGLDLSGSVVFVANCHLWQQREDGIQSSPMLDALLSAGARAVVGGPGENYAKSREVHGADLLGLHFRQAIQLHLRPEFAFRVARAVVGLSKFQDLATADTLAFRCLGKEDL
jgi:hypothetical protein